PPPARAGGGSPRRRSRRACQGPGSAWPAWPLRRAPRAACGAHPDGTCPQTTREALPLLTAASTVCSEIHRLGVALGPVDVARHAEDGGDALGDGGRVAVQVEGVHPHIVPA